MRVGFDISQTGQAKGGCGYYADSLIRALVALESGADFILYSNFGDSFYDPDHAKTTTRFSHPQVARQFSRLTHADAKAFWGQPHDSFEEILGKPDIIHANNYYCPQGLSHAKLVYTLHDLAFFVYPDLTDEANRLVCSNGVFEASLQADLILAVSNHSKTHFLETFPHFPEDQIRVVHPASRFSEKRGAGRAVKGLTADDFWLGVGTLEPRKNWRYLLEAYAQLRRAERTRRKLVLTGKDGWLEEGLPTYIAQLGIEREVLLTGYVDDAQLRWLYENCFAFVYPSLFEGFGMPVLEAMSLGAAVITSNRSSLPEVAGSAGVLIDPAADDSLPNAMLRLEMEPAFVQDRRGQSELQAKNFSWEKSAAQVMGYYQMLLGDS